MNVQQAIEAPRWSTRSFPASPFPHTMYPGEVSVESRVPEAVRAELVRRGHKVFVSGPWSMGSNAAILIDPSYGISQRRRRSARRSCGAGMVRKAVASDEWRVARSSLA